MTMHAGASPPAAPLPTPAQTNEETGKALRCVMCLPEKGYDPTESAVAWKMLREKGIQVVAASPRGQEGAAPQADPIMVDGQGLYLLKWSLRADANGRAAYQELVESRTFDNLVAYKDLKVEDFDGLLLPGGHCPDMKPYLEDETLQRFVSDFAKSGKPIGAICHGVVLAARAGILAGKRVTALPSFMEDTAVWLTKLWMGDYYRTYKGTTVQKEVTEKCGEFLPGPRGFGRDSKDNLSPGFVVRDGNLITGRWPGDAHSFGIALADAMLSMSAVKETTATD